MPFDNKKTFSDSEAKRVWVKQFGHVSSASDVTGKTVYKNDHSENGWHVDHIKPLSKGGSGNLSNLQVLDSEENKAKADHYPTWTDTKGRIHTQYGS